jgi:hypothetical protein
MTAPSPRCRRTTVFSDSRRSELGYQDNRRVKGAGAPHHPIHTRSECFSKIDIILIAFRELVDDSRMGTAIGPRSRQSFFRVIRPISHFLRSAVSCLETARPSSLHVSIIWFFCKLGPLIGASVLALFAPNGLQQAP